MAPPRPTKRRAEWADEPWEEPTGMFDAPPPSRKEKPPASEAQPKARRETNPGDLQQGTVVVYWDGWRGVVRDGFLALDEYWVADEETGELVKGDDGNIVHFKSSELQLVAPPPVVQPPVDDGKMRGGVLLFASEAHIMKILEHFGTSDASERQNPQQLLAVPCNMCDPDKIHVFGSEGVDEPVVELAEQLRSDIHVAVRSFHFKEALGNLKADVRKVEHFYVLSAVQVPYGLDDIEKTTDKRERHGKKSIWNQIDLCVTAYDEYTDISVISPELAGYRALGETCGVQISEKILSEERQRVIRDKMGVPKMALKFVDAHGVQVQVVVLPEDAIVDAVKGLLVFRDADAPKAVAAEAPASKAQAQGLAEPQPRAADGTSGKTVAEWAEEQKQFVNELQLPPNWIRIKSRSTGDIYYLNTATQETTFDFPEPPLPAGWTKQVSKSTGKTYYFNAKLNQSSFVLPKE